MDIKPYFQQTHDSNTKNSLGICCEVWAIEALNDNIIITGSINGTLRLYKVNMSSKKSEHKYKIENAHDSGNSINSITNCPNNSFISCGENGSIKKWTVDVNANTFELASEILYHIKNVTKVILLKDQKYFASCSYDKSIKFWQKDSPHTLAPKFPCIPEWNKIHSILQISNHSDQNLLVDSWGSNIGFISVWDLKDLRRLGTIRDVYTILPNGLIDLKNGNVAVSNVHPPEIVIFNPVSIRIVNKIVNEAITRNSSLLIVNNDSFIYAFQDNYIQIRINNSYDILRTQKRKEKKFCNGLDGTAGLVLLNGKYLVTNNNSREIEFFTF